MSQAPAPLLTFLFTDIEGSTARWEAQREAMSAALQRHDTILRGAIEGQGGQVFKTVGDAFCAVFAETRAALAAALAAQEALWREDWSGFGPAFAELRVRMGLHVGPAEARGGDFFGPALNRSARLMAAGHGGQVLLSQTAREALQGRLPDGVTLRDLGEHRLKDLRHAEHLWQVVAAGLPDHQRSPTTAGELSARDRIVVADGGACEPGLEPTVVTRTVPETLAALHAVIRRDAATVVLTAEQVQEAARHRPADLTEYRLGRIAEWSQARYRLDGRFVDLSLLIDQGEETSGERWLAKQERYDDLRSLLAQVPDPVLVLLAPPGSGKTTLLRRLELDQAIAALRGEDAADRVTFFVQLNQYRARPGQALPDPGDWLAAEWGERFGRLPALEELLEAGRLLLLVDGLNEMPAASEREFRERVLRWKEWLQRLVRRRPGNRVLFSCRSLDYSASLSSAALRVPQVKVEALGDEQVRAFLQLYSPLNGEAIWAAIADRPHLDALRAPFFLALLVDQVEATGEMPLGRPGLFTGLLRQALRRELDRDNPLFALEALLTERDLRRVAQWQWQNEHELPERGPLFPKLAALAYRMQEGSGDGGASQLRVDLDRALDLLDAESDEAIVKAGQALAVLDEDTAAEELLYRHQLLQEFFAAREMVRRPDPERLRTAWRAAEIRPGVPELLATLPPSETLPSLPQTGWEETALLAAAMLPAEALDGFLRGLAETNLALAGRAACLPDLAGRLKPGLLDDLRRQLLARGRDGEADLRHRIACLEALGTLGDPRWERREGPGGTAYLLGPMVEIRGGTYPIGDDAPIVYANRGNSLTSLAHVPRHSLQVAGFRLGRYPVTNGEFACFVTAGGYQDERWWETEDARRWLRGEMGDEGAKQNNRYWRRRFQAEEGLFQQAVDEGSFRSEAAVEEWRHWLTLDDGAFESAMAERWKGRPHSGPALWKEERFNGATQPVVGVSWYEAEAYARWLSSLSGERFRLPTEVEWEAAARGPAGRAFAWGDAFAAARANTFEARLRRTAPVGAWVEGDSPEGISDLTGQVYEWTSSLYGTVDDEESEVPDFGYPYRADDGREVPDAPLTVARTVRGGSWLDGADYALAYARAWDPADTRSAIQGFRLVAAGTTPVSLHQLPQEPVGWPTSASRP